MNLSLSLSLAGGSTTAPTFIEPQVGANVSVTDEGDGTYEVTKTAGGNAWNAWAYSTNPFSGEFVLRVDNFTAADLGVGFAVDYDADLTLNNQVVGWYCGSGNIVFNESGTTTGAAGHAGPAWLIRDASNNVKWVRTAADYATAAAHAGDKNVAGVTGDLYLQVVIHTSTGTVQIACGEPGAFA